VRYEYIDPFVTTTLRVLDCAIPGSIRRGDVTMLQGDRMKGDVAVLVRITGDAEGDIILSMDTATALRICTALFREDFAAMTPKSVDALMELVNMITGNAVSALNDQGFDFTVSPPTVLTREKIRERLPDVESLQIPLFSECGEMVMNVALGSD
jgi:chemotaxis protein CheX